MTRVREMDVPSFLKWLEEPDTDSDEEEETMEMKLKRAEKECEKAKAKLDAKVDELMPVWKKQCSELLEQLKEARWLVKVLNTRVAEARRAFEKHQNDALEHEHRMAVVEQRSAKDALHAVEHTYNLYHALAIGHEYDLSPEIKPLMLNVRRAMEYASYVKRKLDCQRHAEMLW